MHQRLSRFCVIVGIVAWLVSANYALAADVSVQPPTHPTLVNAKLPPLIPTETFFSTKRERWGFRLSPNGKQLLWIALHDDKPAIHFSDLNMKDVKAIPAARGVRWAYWAADSRHITGWWDNDGNENFHFLLADTQNPDEPIRDMTPYPGVKVRFQQYFPDRPLEYLLLHNRRDRSIFDLYHFNFRTGEETLVAENSGDIMRVITNRSGEPIAVQRRVGQSDWSLHVHVDKSWRPLATGTFEDVLTIIGHPPADATWAWARSNRGRDRTVIVKLDLGTGAETIFYENPTADVDGLWVDERTYEPLLAWSNPDYQQLEVFDPRIRAVLELFGPSTPSRYSFRGWNLDKSAFTIRVGKETTGRIHYLVEPATGRKIVLSAPAVAQHSAHLSPMKPVRFKARDGMMINGYLVLPAGTDGRDLPMVLKVHGGPFSRDVWGYADTDQFFANRGYAVLRLNYRGSTGYGRSYIKAADHQFGRKMHTDLIDGVNWAIEQGIADPGKIAIYGHSYGGYATLMGLTFSPEVFAAGIDVVGVADLVTALETFPGYWKVYMARWHAYIGDQDNPADRKEMAKYSPIHYVDQITRPLLVVQGANDVRVVRAHSDRIVEAAQKNGVDVQYIVFNDEGHAIRKWKNRMALARAGERFLAKHLGGRAEAAK